MKRFIWLGLPALLAVGCDSSIDSLQSGAERTAELSCEECYERFGHASSADCYDAMEDSQFSESEEECLEELIARDESAADFAQCALDAQTEYNDCLAEEQTSCDSENITACGVDVLAGLQDCYEEHLTASALEEYNDCVD